MLGVERGTEWDLGLSPGKLREGVTHRLDRSGHRQSFTNVCAGKNAELHHRPQGCISWNDCIILLAQFQTGSFGVLLDGACLVQQLGRRLRFLLERSE